MTSEIFFDFEKFTTTFDVLLCNIFEKNYKNLKRTFYEIISNLKIYISLPSMIFSLRFTLFLFETHKTISLIIFADTPISIIEAIAFLSS